MTCCRPRSSNTPSPRASPSGNEDRQEHECSASFPPELLALKEAAAIGLIGVADGPTSIYVGNISAKTLVLERGDKVAKTLQSLKMPFASVASADVAMPGDVLVVGPGATCGSLRTLGESGVNVLVLGATDAEANSLLPGLGARACSRNEYPSLNASLRAHPALRGVSNADLQWTYPSNVAGLARFGEDVLLARTIGKGTIVFSSIAPWIFDDNEIALRVNRRRASQLVTRLACNLGAAPAPGFLDRLSVRPADGFRLYADTPRQDDDPYRYYRW